MNAEILVYPDPDHTGRAAAEAFALAAEAAVDLRGRACVALSGGATPRGFHRLLAAAPYAARIPWAQVHLFWADERLVPYDHPESNFGAARSDLIERLGHRPAGVHPVPIDGRPPDLARAYEAALRRYLQPPGADEPAFDLILLGLGTDGHTASLFPGSPALEEQTRWTAAVKGGQPDLWRVTLTLPVLNHARQLLLLVTGDAKAGIVRQVLGSPGPNLPPARRLKPRDGRLRWFLDRSAARLLPPEIAAGTCAEAPRR